MSGHSKWATTKHKKAVVDAKRGKMFAKLIKNIEVAARMGGGDPSGNPTLYDAIQKAKKSSVPNDNIDRAVKRGSGAEAGGADYQTIMYEGYGPAGVAMLIECLTDNKNRAAMEVRTAMTRNGGSLADPGSVSFLFNRKGVVVVPAEQEGRTVSRGRRPRGDPRGRRRGRSTTWGSPSRSSPRRPTWSPCAPRSRPPASTTTPPRRRSCPTCRSSSTGDAAGKMFRLDRRPRGPRRRAEHLRQLRRPRRGHGGARRRGAEPARGAVRPRVSYAGSGRQRLALPPNRCSDGKAEPCACSGSTPA